MKLVGNLGQRLDFVLFISSLSVRFRRLRVLYGAGFLMTGFCSLVLLEEVLSPDQLQ